MPPKKDITGKTYGYMKAVCCTGEKYNGSYIWEFECLLCGKRVKKRLAQVVSGEIVSCGCYKNKNLTTIPTKEKLGQIDGTNASRIASRKPQKNNNSGRRGVCLQRQKGKSDKWNAYIGFKGKKYYLGVYAKKEDAIKAREEAEKKLYDNFLEWYENWNKEKTK